MNDLSERRRYVVLLVLVFIAYAATAKLGLGIQPVNDFATLVWAPTGIALAAIVLGGYRLSPAIFMGALVANFATGAPLFVSLGIATGNTLEAVLGALLLRRLVGIQFSFGRLRESILFLICAVGLAPVAGATIGTFALELGGLISVTDLETTWITWWMGDALGALVVAPFLLRWFTNPYYERSAWQYVEMALAITAVSATAFVIFWTPLSPFMYPLFIPFAWAALRTGSRGLTLSIILVAIIALAGTLSGLGPFAFYPEGERLFHLQIFIATVSAIFLIFGSIVEDRRRSSDALQAQVGQLEGAMDKSRAEEEAKTEFLAILAHELRNPLAPIFSSLELLRAQAHGKQNTLSLISTAEKHAQIMGRLLDDLLDIQRVSGQEFKLKIRTVDIRDCIANALQAVAPLMEERRHALEQTIPSEALYLEADPLRIEQILVNLLNNAAKYTPPGGRVALTCTQDANDVVISVHDTGVGIEKEMLERIFEPFVQLDRSQSLQGGVGIGLSLTKRLIEMHGGSIEVFSEGEGRGSEFRVRIPLASASLAPRRIEEPAVPARPLPEVALAVTRHVKGSSLGKKPPRDLKPLKILVVDDNVDAATALSKLLQVRGHDVMISHDGTSTLRLAPTFKPDVIVLDIGLPDMSGYRVAKELRTQSVPAALIALTGYGQESDRIKAREAGFAYHLTKPVGLAQLEEALAHVTQTPQKS